jgi:segregation and condensation protein B
MELSVIIPHVEALIFASEKPLTTLDLVELVNNALGFLEERATLDQVESALEAVREKYNSEFYPFEIRESGGGWQFLTKGSFHKTVALLNGDKFLKRLSTAALETLAIIAYKQPITKGEIENIRGVNCDYAVQKLLEKELVIITGRKEDSPGHPLIYATSKTFMDYFGINSPQDLPKLSDIIPLDAVMPTAIGESNPVDEDLPLEEEVDDNRLAVNAYGEMEEIELESEGGSEEAAGDEDTTEEQNLDAEASADSDESAGNADDAEEEKQEPEA